MSDVSVQEQAEVARELLEGVLDIMELDGDVETVIDEEEVIHAGVVGGNLGLLVGPRGVTLASLEELTRAAVSNAAGGRGARLHLDVGGYRARRRDALADFARQVADEVRAAGSAKALEPMSSADRKVVHDALAEVDGVTTSSAGEDPRRYVVITPS